MTKRTGARTGGRILVDQLEIQGCDRIFTVPGESFLAVLDALHDTPEIDLVVCRQEGGVAYMADADGKMTGRPGVAFVTRGPGATNASGGVHVAFQDSTPMILFVGDVARGDKRPRGLPGDRLSRLLRSDRQMGGADRRCPANPRIYRAGLSRRDRGTPGAGGARAARGHAARRGRDARPAARAAGVRRARSGRDPGPVRTFEGCDQPDCYRRRCRLGPACLASFRELRLPARNPRRRRVSASRRHPQRMPASMPASSAMAPTPGSSSESATRT